MRLADRVFQKLNRRLVAEGRMRAFPVVKNLDVFQGGCLDLGGRRGANALHLLVLEAVEPALHRRVVPAVALAAHQASHAVGLELVQPFAGVFLRLRPA